MNSAHASMSLGRIPDRGRDAYLCAAWSRGLRLDPHALPFAHDRAICDPAHRFGPLVFGKAVALAAQDESEREIVMDWGIVGAALAGALAGAAIGGSIGGGGGAAAEAIIGAAVGTMIGTSRAEAPKPILYQGSRDSVQSALGVDLDD